VINYATMFEASLFGFCIGSAFLNRAHFDLVYHFFAIVVVFEKIALEELRDGAPEELRQPGARTGDFRRIHPGGFTRGPRISGFRDTPLVGERS
jgi:hypothetical protein